MFNRASGLAVGLIASLAVVNPCYPQPRSGHEWLQEQSDYVVIVKAKSQTKKLGFDNIPIEVSTLDVMSVLKGQINENQIDVIVQAESVDLSANCCESGKIYLMYLMKRNGEFTLIRGRDGVYRLEVLLFKGRRR